MDEDRPDGRVPALVEQQPRDTHQPVLPWVGDTLFLPGGFHT